MNKKAINNKICFFTVTWIILLCSATTYASNSAPTTTPSGETNSLIDTSGKTIDITASGGDCDQPNESCQWTKDGSLVYEWSYSGLQGTPASGSEGTTLKIKRGQSGIANVKVKAKQKWKEPGGKTETTESLTSGEVKIKVQKPTSAVQNGNGVYGTKNPFEGIEYTYDVQDQDQENIKTESLDVYESLDRNTVVKCPEAKQSDGSPFPTFTQPQSSGNSAVMIGSVNSNGQFKDLIGCDPAAICTVASGQIIGSGGTIPANATISIEVTTSNHRYHVKNTSDSKTYSLIGTFNRSVKWNMKKDANGGWTKTSGPKE